MSGRLILRPGRERSVHHRHPWLFSGAVDRLEGAAEAGEVVQVCGADRTPLGHAALSPRSRIVARLLSCDAERAFGDDQVEQRLASAIARRAALPASGGVRLLHAECDGLPGVVADRYGDTAVLQLTTPFADRWRERIASVLRAAGCGRVVERSDGEARALEGLPPRVGMVHGTEPTGPITIVEHGLRFGVDVIAGQKTGFYLDQRDHRQRVRARAAGLDVLDAFCYSGGFAVAAAAGGARSVLAIDSSAPALELARGNLAGNGGAEGAVEWRQENVFDALRALRDRGRSFDLIVLDPPKLAPTARLVERAARAYKDLNLLALKLLRPGGWLFTFSCSAAVTPDLLHKIVAGAAADAGTGALVRERLLAAPDHPLLLSFPEGDYLKGLVLEKTG